MKSSKILSLLAATLLTAAVNVSVADENVPTPMVTDGVVDLEQYLFGDVDNNGQTILHRFAANCDNDDFTVRLRLFDFVENAHKSESAQQLKNEIELFNIMHEISPELAGFTLVRKVNDFVQIRDNAGNTAFDIVKKRNELNPHRRCNTCVEILQEFEKLNEKFQK